ncbi:MAG: type III pantothenate kinase [Bacteroidia bacterium]|nr:type III pantothenate kinase [Bacteroidia bacterium]
MNLIFDVGNTLIKVAVFEQKQCFKHTAYNSLQDWIKDDWLQHYTISHVMVSSVTQNQDEIINYLTQLNLPTLLFTSALISPITNLYQTKNTLGSDRLAAAVGGYTHYPNQNVLTIDAGTCIKYNITTANNQYLGGAISPGMRLRYQAMHDYTAKLPLLSVDTNYNEMLGTNTAASITTGAQLGAVAEIDGFIDYYKTQYANLKIILTGGDSSYFENRLKNKIFADELLLLRGLNYILNLNS